ncbi:MAG TPA: hypothetical protein DCG49_08565 [Ruminococcus sp.]|nr:hypothetical protein [Ruminococcus sp.]
MMIQHKIAAKTMILMLCCASGLMMNGCAIRNLENARDESILYLQEKYPGDIFSWRAYRDGTNDYSEISVNSTNYPNADIRVRRYDKDDGISYTDNYTAYCLAQPCADYICSVASQTLGDCKVFCSVNPDLDFCETFSTGTTASALLQSNPMWNVEIDLPPGNSATGQIDPVQITAFQNSAAAYQWNQIRFTIRLLNNQEAYQEKSSYTVGTLKGFRSISDACSFFLDNGTGDIEWDKKHTS